MRTLCRTASTGGGTSASVGERTTLCLETPRGTRQSPAIIQAMLTHREQAAVQEQACAALRVLAYNNTDKKVKIAEAGDVETLAAAV